MYKRSVKKQYKKTCIKQKSFSSTNCASAERLTNVIAYKKRNLANFAKFLLFTMAEITFDIRGMRSARSLYIFRVGRR